jgi:hypothetical protein
MQSLAGLIKGAVSLIHHRAEKNLNVLRNFSPTRLEKQAVRHPSNPSLKGQSLSQIHVSLYSQLLRKHLKFI